MKKIFLTFISLLLLQTCVFAFENSIKFIQVTDTHFSTKNPYPTEVLTALVKDINKQKGVSFVVFTGDNIDQAKPDQLVGFMKIVRHLHLPYYIVMGNHDVFKSGDLSKERYTEIVREYKPLWFHKTWNYKFHKKGYTFLVVDGAKEVIPGASGYFREKTLAWVDKQLTQNKRHPVIILQHFPLVDSPEFGAGRLKTHRVYEAEKYLSMLEKHDNVLAIISGHYHRNAESMQNGIYHINTPSLLSDPPSYKIIDIVSKRGFTPIIYTQLKEVELK